jgi:hypothetical protein
MTREEEMAQYQRWRANASKEVVRMRTALRLEYLAPSTAETYQRRIAQNETKIKECDEAIERLSQ